MLESAYAACLGKLFDERGISHRREVPIPLRFHGVELPNAYRADFIVDEKVILEIKAIELVERIHRCQLRTYLRLSGLELGLMLNFNVPVLKEGVHRVINSARRSNVSPAPVYQTPTPP